VIAYADKNLGLIADDATSYLAHSVDSLHANQCCLLAGPHTASNVVLDSNQCARCNSGYRQSGTQCYPNICSCTSGGTAASGSSCPVNGRSKCVRCNAGRYLSGGKCYSCQPGRYRSSSTTSSSCTQCSRGQYNPSYGQTRCSTCGTGRYSSYGARAEHQVERALCDTLVLGCHIVLKSWNSVGKKGCPCSNPMLEYQ
jgi:hypothetical protein